MTETEIKTTIETFPEGVFTGELTEKKRKSKYDFEAVVDAMKAGKMYALPATVTAETTAINVKKRLAEKNIKATYGTAKGTKQFVIVPVVEEKKKGKTA